LKKEKKLENFDKHLLISEHFILNKNYFLKVGKNLNVQDNLEDFMHELYIKMYKYFKPEKIKNETSFRSWGTKILKNLIIDYQRKNSYKNKEGVRITFIEAGKKIEEINTKYSNYKTPEEKLIENEKLQFVINMLNRMKEIEISKIVYLHYFKELSYREIASILEIREKTVATRIYRSFKTIRETYKKYD